MIYVYPVQHVQRDLPAATLLASHALQLGDIFVLARSDFVLESATDWQDAQVFWGVSPTQLPALRRLRQHGAKIIGFCDEALAVDTEYYRATKADPRCLNETEAYILWSTTHKNRISDRLSSTIGLEVGSPRIDVLYRVPRRFPETVVFASNGTMPFSPVHFGSLDAAKEYVKHGLLPRFPEINPLRVAEQLRRLSANGAELLAALLAASANFPDQQFILRLRFGDDAKKAQAAVALRKNILVQNSGPIGPLFESAKQWFHSDCTTGYEALAIGIPSINFIPNGGAKDASESLPFVTNLPDLFREIEHPTAQALRQEDFGKQLRDEFYNRAPGEPIALADWLRSRAQSLQSNTFESLRLNRSEGLLSSCFDVARRRRGRMSTREALTRERVLSHLGSSSQFSVWRARGVRASAVAITRNF